MPFQIANRKQTLGICLLAPLLGGILAFGFQPLASQILQGLGLELTPSYLFLGLAFLFGSSLSDPSAPRTITLPRPRLLMLCILPWLISFAFGAFKSPPPLVDSSFFKEKLLWAWVIAPVAEEWLFRGWVMAFLNRWTRSAFLPLEPFYPLSLWGSALAFSFWHLQNISSLPFPLLVFQLAYTFFVGIWLGFIKWQTGKISLVIFAHVILNFAADWKVWFVL